MKKSRISKAKQDRLIEHFVAGTTARCAAELIDVNRKTAAYYYQRLRGDYLSSIRARISRNF